MIEVIRLDGLIDYAWAERFQQERADAVEEGTAGDALILLEHGATITLGRKSRQEHLLRSEGEFSSMGIAVCPTDRGGDVTYHGPGQLVAYPILNLEHWRCSIRWYIRSLEEVLIRQLAGYGLKGERQEGFTGVWVGGAKVAAIGVRVHKWVTKHGIALNVVPNMNHFGLIVPCGITDKPVTSLEGLLGEAPSMEQAKDDFEREFLAYFEEAPQD